MNDSDDRPIHLRLDAISTRMSSLQDAGRFVLRYGPAIQGYIRAILRDPNAAEEVWQELMMNLLRRGGPGVWPGQGRFRDYLRTAARNAAISYLRARNRTNASELPEDWAAPANQAMVNDWQRCLLEKVWRELDTLEHAGTGSFIHTALRIYSDQPELDSRQHAQLASLQLGRGITPEAFRQQISRGKRRMAELILTEIAETIIDATAADVEAELIELGLMKFVHDYLPIDWRERFFSNPV